MGRDRPEVFVGRARELSELRAERRRSEGGELRVVVVLGGAGLGKTRLAAEVSVGGPEPTLTLSGRSSRLRPTPPFARWATALGHPVSSAEHIADLLGNTSVGQPVVVILDDAHWADEDFWGMVLSLLQEHAENRLFVVTTARPDQLAGNRAASEVLSTLEQEGALRRVTLDPLGADEIAELAAARTGLADAPPALVDWLMARSQGVPRFAVGLLDGLGHERGDPQAPALRDVPEQLARWVHAEVTQFGAAPLALLELLAVVGNPVDPGDLADIAGEPVVDVALTLERLVRSGMVLEQDNAGTLGYEIAHPMIREVLHASLGGARRRVLNQRAADTLVASGRTEAATPHLLCSARAGDGDAVDALISQARQAQAQGSRATLWAIVPTLFDVLPAGDPRLLELVDALSRPRRSSVRYNTGRHSPTRLEDTRRTLEQLARAADVQAIGVRPTNSLDTREGGPAPGQVLARGAVDLCRQAGRDHESRMAGIELAKIRGWSGDVPGQEADARQLLRDAEEAGDQGAIVGALGALGLALGLQGRFAEAEVALVRGIDLAPSAERSLVETQTNALLASHDASRGHMRSARERWSQAAASSSSEAIVWETGAFIALLSGDLSTVEAGARQAGLDLPQELSPPWLSLFAAMADAEHGRITQARSGLDRVGRDYEGDDLDLFSQFRRWGEGVVAWSEGRLAAAITVLQRAVERCTAMSAFTPLGFLLADLVEIAASAGDSHAAARAAALAEDIDRRVGAPSYDALHHFAGAWSLLAMGRSDEAARAAQRAAEELHSVGFPMLEARARVAYAIATRRNIPAAAADALAEAIAAFDACGAVLRAGRARALLTEVRSDAQGYAGATGEPSLTGRERQIAELAAVGYTARQIGDRLHIGVRTVETHLARTYRKLGVGSKQQLVSRRVELGLAANP